jgi:glycerol kinase
MERFIMALDQGTTSSRCILFGKDGKTVSTAQKEFPQIYPKPGWVEHDPLEIWGSQMGVCQEAMQKIGASAEQIAAIGITNQRKTTVVWDRHTGKPIYNAIVWQCRRTTEFCAILEERGLANMIRQRTGLLPDPYFSGTKIRWILDHVEGAQKRAEAGDLLFGTIDTWLIWNLTKGKAHATDYSNASRTMLFNINKLKWDEDILAELDIPLCMLPEVKETDALYGETDPSLFGGAIPIHAAVGDQQSALFGHGCILPGSAKNTFGTGGFLLMNTGYKPVVSQNNLLTTIAWGTGGHVSYALEGSVFIAGAAIQWLRDEWRLIESSAQTEELAFKVENTNGVYFVPAFVGLGAPYWKPDARGMIVGLTRGTNRNHLVRATLEALAYQTFDVLRAMEDDSGISLKRLKTDGGAAENRFLLQFQADILGVPVERPENIEITAFGAAKFAALAVGLWEREEDHTIDQDSGVFMPSISEEKREELLHGWKRAVNCALYYAEQAEKERDNRN